MIWLPECGSTNDVARYMAERGEPEGVLVVADCQTAGRGRKGDAWHSPAGQGLWCSMLLRPRFEAAAAPGLTLVLARSLVACLASRLGLDCSIKEPNDVLLDGRKLAGILAESATTGNSRYLDFMILGIGVNVSTVFPVELRGRATSLLEHVGEARLPSPPSLLAWLLEEFEPRYASMD